DRIRAAAKQVPAPDRVSNWGWFVPPMHWGLQRRRQEAHKRLILDLMQDEDYEALAQFVNKAVGWILVAVGALLIATKETYGLCREMEWSNLVFWALLVVMAAACNGYTANRISRTQRRRAEHARRGAACPPVRPGRSGRPPRGRLTVRAGRTEWSAAQARTSSTAQVSTMRSTGTSHSTARAQPSNCQSSWPGACASVSI